MKPADLRNLTEYVRAMDRLAYESISMERACELADALRQAADEIESLMMKVESLGDRLATAIEELAKYRHEREDKL